MSSNEAASYNVYDTKYPLANVYCSTVPIKANGCSGITKNLREQRKRILNVYCRIQKNTKLI